MICGFVRNLQGLMLDFLFGRPQEFEYTSTTVTPYESRTHIEDA